MSDSTSIPTDVRDAIDHLHQFMDPIQAEEKRLLERYPRGERAMDVDISNEDQKRLEVARLSDDLNHNRPVTIEITPDTNPDALARQWELKTFFNITFVPPPTPPSNSNS